MKNPKLNCPKCKTNREVIPILYGYPSYEGFKKAEAGKLKLGGCEITEDSPQFYCKACQETIPPEND